MRDDNAVTALWKASKSHVFMRQCGSSEVLPTVRGALVNPNELAEKLMSLSSSSSGYLLIFIIY